jgi:hypothetical protein
MTCSDAAATPACHEVGADEKARNMAKKPTTASPKDLKKASEELKEIRDLIDDLEKVGIEAPKSLTKSLGALQKAIDTAQDVGEAYDEASDALRDYERGLNEICKTVDDDMQAVCEAQVARKYQARAVNYTLDPKNKDSVTSKSIQKTIQRYTPSLVCKHWDYCAKGT